MKLRFYIVIVLLTILFGGCTTSEYTPKLPNSFIEGIRTAETVSVRRYDPSFNALCLVLNGDWVSNEIKKNLTIITEIRVIRGGALQPMGVGLLPMNFCRWISRAIWILTPPIRQAHRWPIS